MWSLLVSIYGVPHNEHVTDRERLAQAIRTRRLALELPVQRAAREAGVDRQTWIKAEAAERDIGDHTAAKIERRLRWQPGSIDRIREGGEPVELPAAPEAPADALDLTADDEERLNTEIARIEHMRVSAAVKLMLFEKLIRLWEDHVAERDTDRSA